MSAVGPVLVLRRSALWGTFPSDPAIFHLLSHLIHTLRAAARPHAPVPLGGKGKRLPVLAFVLFLAPIAVMYYSRFSGIKKHSFHAFCIFKLLSWANEEIISIYVSFYIET